MKKALALLTSIILTACGGGGDDAPATATITASSLNGVYMSGDDAALVSTIGNQTQFITINGSDPNNVDVLFASSLTVSGNNFTLKGIVDTTAASATATLSGSISGNELSLMGSFNNKSVAGTFTKQSTAINLDGIKGTTYTDSLGNNLRIENDLSLSGTILDTCAISGDIASRGHYYAASVNLTGCEAATTEPALIYMYTGKKGSTTNLYLFVVGENGAAGGVFPITTS
ncbi:hypothetical protein [Vibrio sonorensis]|uniref:hypothetical protein n=1 Tax=Vibrio sonorensis TaxID=1004316 RepID=UPI0008D97B96|nr:hypothetical protein [Vibrio sonorensis]